ncbi:CLUMA_CG016293, isoform A [Clunio marinus]|uniref:CLUMA_CG016293, isoform A n=1 Tax=Clunio marinus TaxID=568069 RepID=A0A1J1IT04_9DIPT|nr:CLUMA_CG016293, isoform A [Clunio marinus]
MPHSPSKKTFPIFKPSEASAMSANTPLKRSRTDIESDNEDKSMMEFLEKINQNTIETNKNTMETKEEVRKMGVKFDAINEKMEAIDIKVNKVDDEVKILRNEMEQNKLLNFMDITGVDKLEVEKYKNNLKALAIGIFTSFNISVDSESMERVYTKLIKGGSSVVVVVVFKSFSDKLNSMKMKRESKIKNNIFFDHSMTGETRKLFMSAKKIAKTTGGKIFMLSGKIFFSNGSGNKMHLRIDSDLSKIKSQNSE